MLWLHPSQTSNRAGLFGLPLDEEVNDTEIENGSVTDEVEELENEKSIQME